VTGAGGGHIRGAGIRLYGRPGPIRILAAMRLRRQTMKFLCLAYLERGLFPGPGVAAGYGALTAAMREAGVYIDSGQLSSRDSSKLVRVTAGQAEVSDGPPSGAGPAPTAYFVIDCDGLNDALDWAARIPAAAYGSIEVRPPR
jgi:hypothetical protein